MTESISTPTLSRDLVGSVIATPCLVDDLQEKCHGRCDVVDYVTSPISYEEFFSKYLLPNRYVTCSLFSQNFS